MIWRWILQLPYVLTEQHSAGKRGFCLKSELSWRCHRYRPNLEETRPREAHTGTRVPECSSRRLPWWKLGGRSTCGRQGRSLSLLQRQPHACVTLDYFPLLPAWGGSVVCCQASQRALLWHETRAPCPCCLPFAGPARMQLPCLKTWHFKTNEKAPE